MGELLLCSGTLCVVGAIVYLTNDCLKMSERHDDGGRDAVEEMVNCPP